MAKHKNIKGCVTPVNKGFSESSNRPAKIGADTRYDVSDTRMTAFGGMLSLIKFLDRRREAKIDWMDNVPLNKYRIAA